MRVGVFIGGAAVLAAALVLVPASDAAPKRASKQQLAVIDARQGQMKQLGGAMKTLSGYVKGDGADLAQARAAAALMSRAGASMPHLFPAGTAVGVGDSSTRATLWKERDQFAARVAQFQVATAGLNAATARGDRAEVGQRLGAVGASCKTCHDKWQVKD